MERYKENFDKVDFAARLIRRYMAFAITGTVRHLAFSDFRDSRNLSGEIKDINRKLSETSKDNPAEILKLQSSLRMFEAELVLRKSDIKNRESTILGYAPTFSRIEILVWELELAQKLENSEKMEWIDDFLSDIEMEGEGFSGIKAILSNIVSLIKYRNK